VRILEGKKGRGGGKGGDEESVRCEARKRATIESFFSPPGSTKRRKQPKVCEREREGGAV